MAEVSVSHNKRYFPSGPPFLRHVLRGLAPYSDALASSGRISGIPAQAIIPDM
jgi:hypothetical protein